MRRAGGALAADGRRAARTISVSAAAAGDGVITAAERAAMAAAESTATAAAESERAAYDQEFAPWIEHLIDPYGDALDALNEAFAAAGGDDDDDDG